MLINSIRGKLLDVETIRYWQKDPDDRETVKVASSAGALDSRRNTAYEWRWALREDTRGFGGRTSWRAIRPNWRKTQSRRPGCNQGFAALLKAVGGRR